MAEEKKEKFCFVVCPIGPRESETRKRMNGIYDEVIQPVTKEFGYRAEIAIHDKAPGIVTEGIVTKLIEADLVIADLHRHNGNVMYEVAIRHATGEPIIQMIPDGEDLPFDIGGLNTITYDFSIDQLDRWRKDLRKALRAVADGEAGSNPVARAGMFRALETQEVTTEGILASMHREIGELREDLRRESTRPGTLWKEGVLRRTTHERATTLLIKALKMLRPPEARKIGLEFTVTEGDEDWLLYVVFLAPTADDSAFLVPFAELVANPRGSDRGTMATTLWDAAMTAWKELEQGSETSNGEEGE